MGLRRRRSHSDAEGQIRTREPKQSARLDVDEHIRIEDAEILASVTPGGIPYVLDSTLPSLLIERDR